MSDVMPRSTVPAARLPDQHAGACRTEPVVQLTRLLAAGQQAASRGDPIAALLTYAAAHRACDREHSPLLAAELARRSDRLALRLRPPAALERAAGASASPTGRAWVARVLRLPPPLVLLVLARARWFTPAAGMVWPCRAPLARALLDGLEGQGPPIDALLGAFLLASPLIDPASQPAIERGLAAYAARDYLTGLHLLVPPIEALLSRLTRQLADHAGPDPGAGCGLDGLLRHAPLRRALGEGLVIQLRAVLLAGGSEGLRHRLAHGRLPAAACTRRVTQDLILCYLRLSRRPFPPPAISARAG